MIKFNKINLNNNKKRIIGAWVVFISVFILLGIVVSNALTDDDKVAISTAKITSIQTGVNNFTDDGLNYEQIESYSKDNGFIAGNDSNDSNRIIRSFDKLVYHISYSISGKNDTNDYEDRTVNIKVSLPDNIKDYVTFGENDLPGVSSKTYSFNNISSYNGDLYDSTITLYVLGASNGLEITPKFEISESTNTENEYVVTLGNNGSDINYEYSKENNTYTNQSDFSNYLPSIVSSKKANYSFDVIGQTENGQNTKLDNANGSYVTYILGLKMIGDENGLTGYSMPNGSDLSFNYTITQNQGTPTIKDDFIRLYNSNQVGDIKNVLVSAPYSNNNADYMKSVREAGNISMSSSTGIIKDFKLTYNSARNTAKDEVIGNNTKYIGTYAVTAFSPRTNNSTSDFNVTLNTSNLKVVDTNNETTNCSSSSGTVVNSYFGYSNYELKTSFLDSNNAVIDEVHNSGSASRGTTLKYNTEFLYKKTGSNQGLKEVIKIDNNAFRVVSINENDIEITTSSKELTKNDFEVKFVTGDYNSSNYNSNFDTSRISESDIGFVNNCPSISGLTRDQVMNLYGGPCISGNNGVETVYSSIDEAVTSDNKEIPITKVIVQTKEGVSLPDETIVNVKVGVRVRNVRDITQKYQITTVASTSDYDSNLYYYVPSLSNEASSITNKNNFDKNDINALYGDSIEVTNFSATSDISVTNKNSDGTMKTRYNNNTKENITFVVKNKIEDYTAEVGADDTWFFKNVEIVVSLPKELEFISDESNLNPTIENGSYGTILKYTLPYTKPNTTLKDIKFKTKLSSNIKGSSNELLVSSYLYPININNEIDSSFKGYDLFKLYAAGVNGVITSQNVKDGITNVDKNEEFSYLLEAYNNSDEDINNYEIVDILPKNGENNSNYNGSYKVKVTIPASLSTAKVKCSTQTSVTAETQNNYNEFKNCSITEDYVDATAIKITNINISNNSNMEPIIVTIKPIDNKANDKYVNYFVGGNETYNDNESNKIEVNVISRKISGKVFIDNDENALYDSSDKLVSNIPVSLYKIEGEDLNKVTESVTDNNGYYEFKNLSIGRYKVRFNYDSSLYDLTNRYESIDETVDSDAYKISEGTAEISGKHTLEELDGIILSKDNIEANNMDLGLISRRDFYLDISKYITKVDLTYNNITDTYNYNNETKVKLDVRNSLNATAKVYYGISITNNSGKTGYVKMIQEDIPDGMIFDSTDPYNSGWFLTNGIIQNVSLENDPIAPGETRYLKIALNMPKQNEARVFTNTVTIVDMQEKVNKTLAEETLPENDNNYHVGEQISYSGINWHVISTSDTQDGSQVLTLLADSGSISSKLSHTNSSSDVYKWSTSNINRYLNNMYMFKDMSKFNDNYICDDASSLQVASYGGTLQKDGTCQSGIYTKTKVRLLTEKEFNNIKRNYSNISWLFGNNNYWLQNAVYIEQSVNSYGQIDASTDASNMVKYVDKASATVKTGSHSSKEVRPVIEIDKKYILQD